MPAKSKAQQRFMGMVHAYKKGELKGSEVSKAIKKAAKGMKKKTAKDYASTKCRLCLCRAQIFSIQFINFMMWNKITLNLLIHI